MANKIGDNLRIRTLRQQIIDDLNNSELPFEVLRMILSDILSEVTDLTEKALQDEIKALKEITEKKSEKEQGVKSDGQTNENIDTNDNVHS